ncbi:MAG: hypothetical protein HUJ75_01860, partial [Parasporobacterium sp.]|nr:hypothetical protein [Parasporobacterium sp.]
KEELAEFLLVDGMEEDIRSTLGSMIDRCSTGDRTGGNLIITGDQKSGKTYMTISLIKAVSREMGEGAGKVAKVKAEALNGKDFVKVFGRIGDSHLVIENVGNMDDSTVADMLDAMRNGGNKGMVVLEGNKLAIANIAMKFPEIWDLFLNRLDIEELSISKWAEVGCKYAVEQGYDLDDLAVLALHARIDEIKVPTERLGYEDIMNLVEDAMEKADKRHKGRLFGSKKNGGRKILTEADFL